LADHVAEYTMAVVEQSKVDGIGKYRDIHLSKAVIRTYLAWRDPPDRRYPDSANVLGPSLRHAYEPLRNLRGDQLRGPE
jgi:hypothetical protein